MVVNGELNPKIDFSSFEHLGIVIQLYEDFLKLFVEQSKKILMFCNESTRFDRRFNMRCQRLFMT